MTKEDHIMTTLKITPLDIYNKEFKKKFSIVAYDEKEVDEFLDHVAANYERLYKELNQLKDENERLKRDLSQYQQLERTLQETMVIAQENAKERRSQAEREAQMVIDAAKNRAREITSEAKDLVKERLLQINQLQEYEQFFRARFKSLMDSMMQLMNTKEMELPEQLEELEKEIAISTHTPDDDDVNNWVEDLDFKPLLEEE
jgi:cell division initiation protein